MHYQQFYVNSNLTQTFKFISSLNFAYYPSINSNPEVTYKAKMLLENKNRNNGILLSFQLFN